MLSKLLPATLLLGLSACGAAATDPLPGSDASTGVDSGSISPEPTPGDSGTAPVTGQDAGTKPPDAGSKGPSRDFLTLELSTSTFISTVDKNGTQHAAFTGNEKPYYARCASG